MVTPQYFVHTLKRLNLMHNKLPMWKHCLRGFIWMVTLQDFLHRLKISWTTLHFSIVDFGGVAKWKSGRQHNEKKHIALEAKRRKHCELLVFLSLFLPYFVKISGESIRTNKIELSVLDRYFTACFSSSISLSLSIFCYRETRDLEGVTSWKRSIGKRYFPLCSLPDNWCWKIILQLIFINKFCCSNPQSSVLWSQLASYLLQACPDELQVYYHWCGRI